MSRSAAGWGNHFDVHQKTIELCLGKRVGAFLLNGVLRGHHREQHWERIGCPTHTDLTFCHGQQRRLNFRGCSIDFIGQNQIVKDGTRLEFDVPNCGLKRPYR